MTRARRQHRAMVPRVVAISTDELSLEQAVAPEVELLHQTLGRLCWGKA